MNAVTDDDRTWGSLAHLSALCGLLIPFGSLLGPLIMWRTRGQRTPFVGDQALEALNFNISIALGFLACLALVWLFVGILVAWWFVSRTVRLFSYFRHYPKRIIYLPSWIMLSSTVPGTFAGIQPCVSKPGVAIWAAEAATAGAS